jgi:L-seryl-tRNA(Ser) seleniumtransferase
MSLPSLRDIPSVDELLSRPAIAGLSAETSRGYVAGCIREVLEEVRAEIRSREPGGADAQGDPLADLEARIAAHVHQGLAPSLAPVINATGVLLHTNLGRAPLSATAAERVRQAAASYTNLEYDLAAGERGQRDVHASRLLRQLLGQPAVVVNNNAAAVLLVLNTLAEGGEVVVSRGELVEIGGSFRIPEIMAKSGAVLREVGATNRTRIADYQAAINERTRLLLRVHPSNFRMVGFTERVSLESLLALGQRAGIPVFEDLGSGCMFDLRPYGIDDEPLAADSLRAGVDLVSFSGDKLLGGPQAGIIAGRPELIEKVRRNPLFRALRVDKMTYAALEATLADYFAGRLEALPIVGMIRAAAEEIGARARALIARLGTPGSADVSSALGAPASSPAPGSAGSLPRHAGVPPAGPASALHFELLPGRSVIGGGSAPGRSLDTTLVAVTHPSLSASQIEERLRGFRPPVIARVEDDRVLLDLRTVFPEQEPVLLDALLAVGGRR